MGCASVKNTDPLAEDATRKHLYSGAIPLADGESPVELTEEDRGLIMGSNGTVIDLVCRNGGDGGYRKFSIGSQPDQCKMSFANKAMQQVGDEIDAVQLGVGYTCRKGLKPESLNQDSWFVLKVDGNYSIYAVFDGHGLKGHDVSNFVKESLPKLIIRDPRFKTEEMPQMLMDAFRKCQCIVSLADRMKKLSAQLSGTTATVGIHDHASNKLTMAHVADSTAVMGRYTNESRTELVAMKLTRDHKPSLKDERARIERCGGRVIFDGYANHRVYAKNARYPGLNMSRCLGDLLGHQDCGISCEPECSEQEVTELDHVLLLCSDGVWEFVNAQEAVEIVSEFPSEQAELAAEALAREAWDRWIFEQGGAVVDDITVVVVYLQHGVMSKAEATHTPPPEECAGPPVEGKMSWS